MERRTKDNAVTYHNRVIIKRKIGYSTIDEDIEMPVAKGIQMMVVNDA